MFFIQIPTVLRIQQYPVNTNYNITKETTLRKMLKRLDIKRERNIRDVMAQMAERRLPNQQAWVQIPPFLVPFFEISF